MMATTATPSTGAPLAERRATFYKTHFPDFWWDIHGSEYALYDVHLIDKHEVNEIRKAAQAAWRIYTKAGQLIRTLPPNVLEEEMGIPATALDVVRTFNPAIGDSVVTRFDFIKTNKGFKVIELNAETPFFYWESNRISGEVAKSFGYEDPNEGAEETLIKAIRDACRASGKTIQNVAVTAYNPYREDVYSAEYIRSIMECALNIPVTFVPIHELHVDENHCYQLDAYGEEHQIDFLYRCYPTEHFAMEEGGKVFFDLIEQGKLVVINPPSALLIQNKMAQAIIWNLSEAKTFFTRREQQTIRKYFLPTYADLPDDGQTYVQKPVLGREGNTVKIIRPNSEEHIESQYQDYDYQTMVYQLFVESPLVKYQMTTGEQEGFAITTCFVVGGKATAIGMRVGSQITDGWAHFFPVALKVSTAC